MPEVSFTPRPYQSAIAKTATQGNTLIVLPTGLGKTNVFLLIAAERLHQRPNGKIVLLGPTRPLIDQYERVFRELTDLDPDSMIVLTGRVAPEKRAQLFTEKQVVFSTPQGFENDLVAGRISLDDVVLLGFDEAHRATGEYSYVWIAKQYAQQARYPRIVALTASPGADKTKIREVMEKLSIDHVEVRSAEDADVKPYVQAVDVTYEYVELPDNMQDVIVALKDAFRSKLRSIAGYLGEPVRDDLSRTELLKMQAQLQGKLAAGRDFRIGKALSLAAEAMKVQHGLELAESQGVHAFVEYARDLMDKAEGSASKATKNLASDTDFRKAYARALSLAEQGVVHPKAKRLIEMVGSAIAIKPDTKIIVFNSYRDNATTLVRSLNELPGVRAELFVGQAKKKGSGLSQKEQKAMLEAFGSGDFNVLVSTSIGEEGLDIPKVDQVIFYEPVPSTIRAIQRRGRTGRNEKGSVTILVTKGTRDEAYMWSARSREKKMNRTLKEISAEIAPPKRAEPTLKAYDEGITIFADTRERANPAVKELIELGAKIELERLDVGDFLLSSEVVVEFKTADDFVDSIIDGRLLSQAASLRRDAIKPIVMVEGFETIYAQRNIHPNAIRGVLSSLAVDFQLTILPTKNSKDSAAMLYAIARREQLKGRRPAQVHAEKGAASLPRTQEYLVSSLPGIGKTLARPVLERFGTIRALANADAAELQEVEKIGKKKAADIHRLFNEKYDPTA